MTFVGDIDCNIKLYTDAMFLLIAIEDEYVAANKFNSDIETMNIGQSNS